MTTSAGDLLAGVLKSSARYAGAVTRLSDLYAEAERHLAKMPGKAAVGVCRNDDLEQDALDFSRGLDGEWEIWYRLAATDREDTDPDFDNPPEAVRLVSASVDLKLKAASLLPRLIDKLHAELSDRAESAEKAAAEVERLLKGFPKGGV